MTSPLALVRGSQGQLRSILLSLTYMHLVISSHTEVSVKKQCQVILTISLIVISSLLLSLHNALISALLDTSWIYALLGQDIKAL